MTEVKGVAVDFDPFAAGEIARTAPITSPQREIWSAVQVGGEDANRAYNEGLCVVLTGALDVPALEAALADLVARHEALRTTLSSDGSKLLIAASGTLPLEQEDLRNEADPIAAYRSFERERVDRGFDLQRGPLAYAGLARVSEREHRLLLILHHIICDGWSFGVLMSELAPLYTAHKAGVAAQLEPAESFIDYAEERARHASSPESRSSLLYWVEQFKDSVPTLELPLDAPRPPVRTYRAERVEHELGPELVDALRAFAKQNNVSLFQLLLSSFQCLLARLSNQWDLVVGISAAGQASSGRHGLVGHAVSFLPIRARIDADAPFRAALAQTKRTLGDALEHQDITFGTLLEHLVLGRDPSRIPLAPINFNVDQALAGGGFEGLELFASNVARTHEAFEMFINIVDRKQTFVIEAQYNVDLFSEETLRDWLESYEALLAGLVRTPDQPVGKLPVLSPAARRRIVEEWNDTRTAFDASATMHALFEQQVDRDPAREAVAFEGQRISYGELDVRANRLAHLLKQQGVGPESKVGVCVRRSIDMVVAQLAVLKAGAAYLPLDPGYPPERLAYMLADSGARIVISRTDSIEALGTLGADVQTVLYDVQRDELHAQPESRPDGGARGENIAYVIYTSGSTGKPKGVLVKHENFANFLVGMDQRIGLSPPGVWLCATSIGFDISVLELFGAFARGFTVVLHSAESGVEYSIPALIKQHQVTHFQCTPSQATIVASEPDGSEAIGQLRELLLGGEALPVVLAQKLVGLLQRGRLINMYGPTETTIWSTTHEVRDPERSIPLGKPIANTQIYVLDERSELVARGAIGELYIAGAGVTRGYHERPELTRERFVPDPYASTPDARMYKTGDLVRQRADGALEFFGRNDFQVKIRGFRIELGEIEEALRTLVGARECVVVARTEGIADTRLVAYLVPGESTSSEPKVLREQLRARLPDHMLPSTFVTMQALPLTGSGKVDRARLPAPAEQPRTTSAAEPASDLERKIAECWKSVLGIRTLGVEDNFFDVGGHSLLMVRLAAELQTNMNARVSIPDLFRYATVRALAGHLADGGKDVRADVQERASARRAAPRNTQGRRG